MICLHYYTFFAIANCHCPSCKYSSYNPFSSLSGLYIQISRIRIRMSCKNIQVQLRPCKPPRRNNNPVLEFDRQNPSTLTQMALNMICKSLRTAVKNLDLAFEQAQQDSASQAFSSSTYTGITQAQDASMTLTLGIMKIKRYIQNNLTPDIRAVLLEHALTHAVMSKAIAIVRFIVTYDIAEDLSLCGLDFWKTKLYSEWHAFVDQCRNTLPGYWQRESEKRSKETKFSKYLETINPPNEFDWYSADKMGRIISFNDVIELFSILKSVKCQGGLKSLALNARRESFSSVHKNYDNIISELICGFTSITTLVLRGMADNNLLKIIGKTLTRLKVLDISYSRFVTDQGLKHLFYNESIPSAILLILQTVPTCVKQSTKSMNCLHATLYYLDFSYTDVSTDSLAFVRGLPGAFVFKRSFALSEKSTFGHVIFLRQKANISGNLLTTDPVLGPKLQKSIGKISTEQLLALVRNLKWENKYLHLFKLKDDTENGNNFDISIGIISSGDHGFVRGLFKIKNRQVRYIYSDEAINLSELGRSLVHLEAIQGVVTGECNSQSAKVSGFTTITKMDVLAEPSTIYSIFKSCSNLVHVKFRVTFKQVGDDAMIAAVTGSRSRLTLKEFWMAPGTYKQSIAKSDAKSLNDLKGEDSGAGGTLVGQGKNSEVDQLCKLSIKTAKELWKACTKLRRLGDLAWWSLVSSEELAQFCRHLQNRNSSLVITFDDILLPDFELVREL